MAPVIITKTQGFWDKEIFMMASIFFNKSNVIESWKKDILEIYKMNEVDYDQIVKNGLALIKNHYDLKDFNKKIEKYYLHENFSSYYIHKSDERQDPWKEATHAIKILLMRL